MLYLKEEAYTIEEAEKQFPSTHEHSYLKPVIVPNTGESLTVMCRSAKSGILYLDSYAWQQLAEPDVWLFVKTGNKPTDRKLFKSQAEVAKDEAAKYRIFRLEASQGLDEISRIMDAPAHFDFNAQAAGQLRILLRMHEGTEFDSIYEKVFEKEGKEDAFLPSTSDETAY